MKKLFETFDKNGFSLKNHLVMAPMTRSRAVGNQPNRLMAEYYAQRSGAGLIITEGTAPTPEALGYSNIPGIFNQSQVMGWQLTTNRVHQAGSKIFLQLMHTGRIGHNSNLPEGTTALVGASDMPAAGEIFTANGMQPHSKPVRLSEDGIKKVIAGFVTAAQNAVVAGFDGVELHGANGYLLEQFLNPNVNNRTDAYGGSVENRIRFTMEAVQAVADAIGKEKVGIRFSPFSSLGDLAAYEEADVHKTYVLLAQRLNEIGIRYIHIGVNAPIPPQTLTAMRANFAGTLILCNGLTAETAEEALHAGLADLVAFGRAFLANPDLVERIEKNAPLNEVQYDKLYSPGAAGYTDYPTLAQADPVS